MHRTTTLFWQRYQSLSSTIQDRANKCFALLKNNPRHPSLHFKKVGKFWSVRIDINHRALAVQNKDDFIWVWIGSHDEYDRITGTY